MNTTPPVEAQPVIHLTGENFNTFTLQIPNVIIDFWAEWCGPCRYFAPIFEEASKEYPEIQFCKCNTEENEEIAQQLRISSIPTIMFIKNGTVVRIRAGAIDLDQLRTDLNLVFRS